MQKRPDYPRLTGGQERIAIFRFDRRKPADIVSHAKHRGIKRSNAVGSQTEHRIRYGNMNILESVVRFTILLKLGEPVRHLNIPCLAVERTG